MFVPSYLAVSRHGIYYFRWPLRVAASLKHRSSSVKVSLLTRDPKEALRLSRALSDSAQQLVHYGTERGMTFEEIRTLLTTHFSQMLAQRKLQIATNGRLTPVETSSLENGLALPRNQFTAPKVLNRAIEVHGREPHSIGKIRLGEWKRKLAVLQKAHDFQSSRNLAEKMRHASEGIARSYVRNPFAIDCGIYERVSPKSVRERWRVDQ